MMEYVKLLIHVILGLQYLEECSGFPVDLINSVKRGDAVIVGLATPGLLAVALLGAAAALVLGCACCPRRKGFRELNNSVVSSQQSVNRSGASGARGPSELTIFPPVGVALPPDRSSVVQFEPLPEIRPHHGVPLTAGPPLRKPPVFHNQMLSSEHWFVNAGADFPRNQLQYLREVGRGWFGRVVEGEAKGIHGGKLVSKVVVKILDEDATSADQMYFLEEVKPYRDLRHPNVLRLVGRCLETAPFLVLLESCPSGNLKSFLCQNISSADALSEEGVTLSMACGVTSGLQHMLENGFVHTDLAARNCLVSADLTVKVGDYGTSVETFKDEYYCAGDMALPIRWCAPETLHCTDTIIETKEVTASANVWSLAVVVWEICEFGSLPYTDCSDEQVLEYVVTSGSKRLPPPSRAGQPHAHNLYHLMKLCWNKAEKRPPIGRVSSMLKHLFQHCHSPAHTSANNNNNSRTSLDDFERRWEMSKPNTIPKCDDAVPIRRHSLEIDTPPQRSQPEASLAPFASNLLKSPSLTNLRGSMDELSLPVDPKIACQTSEPKLEDTPDLDSWLKGMDTSTEEDVRFVRNISEAIRDLDDALAQERTSSSSQGSSAKHTPSNGPLHFRLGPITSAESALRPSTSAEELDSLNRKLESSGSDTEDEAWRIRIERGEFTEKVKEKSKSVADLMVLTHIDNSDTSDKSDSDSLQDVDVLDSSLKRNNSIRRKPLASSGALGYGSDGNIHGAVLGEELRETIRRLHESWRDESRLEVIADASLPYSSLDDSQVTPAPAPAPASTTAPTTDPTTDPTAWTPIPQNHFLGKAASDTSRKSKSSQKEESCVEEAATPPKEDEEPVSVILGPSEDFTLDYFRGLKTVYAEPVDDTEEDDGNLNLNEGSIETWDKFLNNYRPSEADYPSFSQLCFSQSEPNSPGRSGPGRGPGRGERRGSDDILGSSFETTPAKVILSSEDVSRKKMKAEQVREIYLQGEKLYSSNESDCLRNNLTDKGDLDSPIEHIEDHMTSDDSIYGSMKLSDYADSTKDSTGSNMLFFGGEKRFKLSKDLEEDEDDYCLDPTKNHTPDDERSSDSGFRDKGSLSESCEDACEDACDDKYNVEDVELDEAFSRSGLTPNDPCQRLDVLLAPHDAVSGETVVGEAAVGEAAVGEAAVGEDSADDASDGWFLHPRKASDIASLTLDEEFANAIRNELRDKLNAFQQSQESSISDEESLSDSESEESPDKERTNMVIQYKSYSAFTPLSPILEENLSSDSCSTSIRLKSGSESEPLSPVMVLDPSTAPSTIGDPSNFEDDILKALSECPAEADENWSQLSFDGTSEADDDPDTLPLDSDSLNTESKKAPKTVDVEDFPELDDDDDVLLVDTETNEVTLVEKSEKVEPEQAFGSLLRPETLCWTAPARCDGPITPDSISPDILSPWSPTKAFLPQETSYGQIEEILPNNEAAEIVADLENCGVIPASLEFPEQKSPTYSSLPKIEAGNLKDSSLDLESSPSQRTVLNLTPLDVQDESIANVDSIKESEVYQPEELKLLAKRICDAQIKYYAKHRHDSIPDSESNHGLSSPTSHVYQDITIEEIDGDTENENEVDVCPVVSDDVADDQLMSTSFMVTDNDDGTDDGERIYPLDWDWESDDANSSSSGEFIWKDGETEASVKVGVALPHYIDEPSPQSYDVGVPEYTMASIVEEEEEEDESSSDCGDSESETEFVPSAWNSEATPKRSALRAPHRSPHRTPSCSPPCSPHQSPQKQEEKKSVTFKRQRYHCVYEYPREVYDSSSTDLDGGEYDFMYHDDVSEDDEFFISSSARPFDYLGVSSVGGDQTDAGGSEFFPGRDLASQDNDADESTSESDPEMVTASEHSAQQKSGEDSSSDAYRSLASNDSADLVDGADATDGESPAATSPPSPLSPVCALGELRHTRDRLKLDLLLEAPPKAALKKRSSAEQKMEQKMEEVKGEASLLDGDEDIDDSGIDSGIDQTTRRTFHTRPEPALELANSVI